jgi:uncharacterized membrane protein
MNALHDVAAGPWGAALAILAMAIATYLCRASGIVLMSRVRITPRVERALQALPGSIVVATILPIGLEGGLPAVLALAAAIFAMSLLRWELAALTAGLATITLVRALGF